LIKLYTASTPNGRKVSIALEELALPYEVIHIDISKGDQFEPSFLEISPSNKIPAIVDGDRSMMQSGAILLYLAAKSGRLVPAYGTPAYWEVMEWLMWQMSEFGPMLGQAHHFLKFNRGISEYAEERYGKEARRLYKVLNTRLEGREFVVDGLSMADIAIWPWASRFEFQSIDLDDYPNVKDWYLRLASRPAFQRGYAQPVEESIPKP
jgi:GST-like protein